MVSWVMMRTLDGIILRSTLTATVDASKHEEHRQAHDQGRLELGGHGQGRADAQHLQPDGIVVDEGVQ